MGFKEGVSNWARTWKEEIIKNKYLIILALVLLFVAIRIQLSALNYTTELSAITVPDIILDHIPALDLSSIFVYGIISVYAIAILYFLLFKIKEAHIVISQFSLLLLIRSFFLILTHLGQPARAIVLTNLPFFYNLLNFRNDLFFSMHTAAPFLFYLIFRKEKIGKFFLIMSFVMAFTVLFMHVHYSIDVFAAFFITFGSYKIGEYLIKRLNE